MVDIIIFLLICSKPYRIAPAVAPKPYRIGLLFAHSNVDFGTDSVTERVCEVKVDRRISDRFCAS